MGENVTPTQGILHTLSNTKRPLRCPADEFAWEAAPARSGSPIDGAGFAAAEEGTPTPTPHLHRGAHGRKRRWAATPRRPQKPATRRRKGQRAKRQLQCCPSLLVGWAGLLVATPS
eukprot:TRINITY_DN26746_c0_g1_i3.p2 TRINITY_DN26746_c0_g1~~TRINITY_DN26746_c0_g1_i3.p2  ORF type:complete len:116 (+),score=10.13 TRINITY_DN26746_c0_g1_i3:50-397(+)